MFPHSDLGRYGSSPGVCTDCPPGRYQDGKGSKQCLECPKDTYSTDTGKSSKKDCIDCDSDRSTGKSIGNIDNEACLCKRTEYYQNTTNECQPCPTGADCSHKNGIPLLHLVAKNGYWRPTSDSVIFSDCRQGYTSMDRDELALDRCCPLGKCNNSTGLNENGTMFTHPDEQCKDGYKGALCLVCQKDYVFIRGGCEFCMGGAIFSNAAAVMISFCMCVAFIVLVILLCAPSKKTQGEGDNYFGQLKIILSFVQILAAIPGVYDNVPWPTLFIDFTIPLNFMNFEFLSLLMESTCSLAVPFLDQFVLHMCLPVVLYLSIGMAYVVSRCCIKSVAKRKRGNELISQILILKQPQ